MIYRDLINLLSKFKTPEDLENAPENLFDEMMNASLATGMNIQLLNDPTPTPQDALKNIQIEVNRHIEAVIEEL